MDEKEKNKIEPLDGTGREKEKVSRREAMKRMAKGVALVGALGVTAVVTKGQGSCGYYNAAGDGYYYDYQNSYNNYANINMYTEYSEYYYNYYNYSNYEDYYNYSDYQNYYDYSENYSNVIWH